MVAAVIPLHAQLEPPMVLQLHQHLQLLIPVLPALLPALSGALGCSWTLVTQS